VLAVGGAEGVVDVDVAELRKPDAEIGWTTRDGAP
jgi:hypothetical protein